MRLTRYSRAFVTPEHPGKVVLFSTRTAASILVPAGMLDEIERGALCGDEVRTLNEQGFLVESEQAERRDILGYVDELAAMERACKPLVVLNLDCNLACVYCFEGTRKGRHYLSDETAARIIGHLERHALPGRDQLHVTFYGGEPLLSMDRMLDLAGRMKRLCAGADIPFAFSLVTNGTLLTRDRVERMLPLGLRSAAITLDGPPETHDLARPFRSGRGSHDVILTNLKAVAGLVDLQLGGNFTAENWRSFPALLDALAAQGLTPAAFSDVRFDPVFREADGIAPPDFHGGCTTLDEAWVLEASVALREEILRRGYRTGRVLPSRCMVDFPGRPVVNYDGGLYACAGFIGREECRIGDVGSAQGPRGGAPTPNWHNETCLSCAYLPLCFGGCRYMALLRTGSTAGVDCRKAYFDAVLEPMVMQDIRYGVQA